MKYYKTKKDIHDNGCLNDRESDTTCGLSPLTELMLAPSYIL